jgi:valyl-tRNA synthetase
VERASLAMEAYDYAVALDVVEAFFWSRFTDTYVELVKNRARSEDDPVGRASAVAALQLALRAFLRLLAPFLPYITEEVWSWGHAAAEGAPSIHRAKWPEAGEFPKEGPEDARAFDAAFACLESIHRAKSAAGASVGRHLARLRLRASPVTAGFLQHSLADLRSAARAEDCVVEAGEGLAEDVVEVAEIELAQAPAP